MSVLKKKELWRYLKTNDRADYGKIRLSLLGRLCNLPGKGGRQVSVTGYKVVQKIYGSTKIRNFCSKRIDKRFGGWL